MVALDADLRKAEDAREEAVGCREAVYFMERLAIGKLAPVRQR
ncbi:MAG: hypothetical protein U5L07_14610 [Desulfobacterales bacterium]|nr:hypothetical protein [Desulfobacterales bacterium]